MALPNNILDDIKEMAKKHAATKGVPFYHDDYIAGATEYATKAQKLAEALKIIQSWQLPPTGQFWDKEETDPMSFEAAYGSNGARDFIRNVANEALAEYNQSKGTAEVDIEQLKSDSRDQPYPAT